MLKIPESGLIHFPLYRLRYKNKNGCVIYYPGIVSTAEVPGTPYRISGTLEFSCIAYQERASDAFADSCANIAHEVQKFLHKSTS